MKAWVTVSKSLWGNDCFSLAIDLRWKKLPFTTVLICTSKLSNESNVTKISYIGLNTGRDIDPKLKTEEVLEWPKIRISLSFNCKTLLAI